ncbi:signal transduction histidine kinase [Kaistia hirudinis]|uniref:histidine kinase n=1 Tax=Kaistia hirudinis TaxID=1293440 RepID=A0A840AVF9_9HYPH|nr:HAMP domain-containing sensor histidine kinase [Kaistia hirudinis]MBB3932425.1 signal transduction histidine kinase [Kaistia hirudinis]
MRVDLFKSTPFRLTVILGAAFLFALLVAGGIAFIVIRNELAARADASISDTYSVIRQSFGDSDIADLTALVQSHADATVRHEQVYLLRNPDGTILAGNIVRAEVGQGWSTVESEALGLDNEFTYRVFVGDAGGNAILVGVSSAESDAIGWLALVSFAWAGVVFLVLVGAAGLIVARRGQRRLETIAGVMDKVGRGELHARIPITPAADDIDQLSGQVNAALDRLLALVEGMRQVSMDIAHDLKTPLNRLAITIEGAIATEAKGASAATLLAQAQSEGRQINATFDALLRISQIEAGARRSRFLKLSIAPVLHNIWEVYADDAAERGQRLELSIVDNLPPIAGDRELLTQMVANLVENAIRHCSEGTEIRMAALLAGDRVRFEISDNGPGIPPDERQRVFQRLYRLDKSRTTPGTGLGLSLVKAIADLHGAAISLNDNAPGLRVRIDFPRS